MTFLNTGPGDDSLARRPLSQGSTIGRVEEFVPRDFDVARRLETPQFVLEPLDPEHSDQDYDAWTFVGGAHPRDARMGGQQLARGR